MQYILKKLKNKKNRSAFFVCSLTYKLPYKKGITINGKIEGTISKKMRGKNGFGYDPIFIPYGHKKTFSEMEPKTKMSIDHRFKAFLKIPLENL